MRSLRDFYNGICPTKELEERLLQESKIDEIDDWMELWSYLNLKKERFDELVLIVEKKLTDGNYTKFEIYEFT